MALAPALDPRCFVVSIRAPFAFPPGYGWYPVTFTPTGITADESPATDGRDRLATFLAAAPARFPIDPARIFLLGFSQGAALSLYVALSRPTLVAGAAILSGRLMPMVAAEVGTGDSLAGKRFFVAHGLYDDVLPVTQGRAIRDLLATLPVSLSYREYPMGHTISPESLDALSDWLTAQL
jgi:phospholipase/carboxylesterase